MARADGSTSHRPEVKQTSYSNLKYKFMNKTFIRQAKRSFTFLFMLGLCAIWSPRAAAQNRSLPQVTIRMDRVPMSQIMSEIERQTKYLFVTGSDVKTDRITSLDVTAVPLTEALNRMVAENGYHLNTGSLGTKYLFEALSQTGHSDVACKALTQTSYPSYGYMLREGATSFWETICGADDFGDAGSLCHGWSALPVYYYETLQ